MGSLSMTLPTEAPFGKDSRAGKRITAMVETTLTRNFFLLFMKLINLFCKKKGATAPF